MAAPQYDGALALTIEELPALLALVLGASDLVLLYALRALADEQLTADKATLNLQVLRKQVRGAAAQSGRGYKAHGRAQPRPAAAGHTAAAVQNPASNTFCLEIHSLPPLVCQPHSCLALCCLVLLPAGSGPAIRVHASHHCVQPRHGQQRRHKVRNQSVDSRQAAAAEGGRCCQGRSSSCSQKPGSCQGTSAGASNCPHPQGGCGAGWCA